MRADNFIEALAGECRTDRNTVEDVIRAFTDLIAEHLERGDQIRIASFGRFGLRPYMERSKRRKKVCVSFMADPELRTRLQLADPPVRYSEPCPSCKTTNPGLCETCGSRKRHVAVYKDCSACIHGKMLEKKKRRSKAA
jgi:nucleoid DNA-binding protein